MRAKLRLAADFPLADPAGLETHGCTPVD